MDYFPTYSTADKTQMLSKAAQYIAKNKRRPSEAELPGARTLSDSEWKNAESQANMFANAQNIAKENPGILMPGSNDALIGAAMRKPSSTSTPIAPKQNLPIGGAPALTISDQIPPMKNDTSQIPTLSEPGNYTNIFQTKAPPPINENTTKGVSAFNNAVGQSPAESATGSTTNAPRNVQGALNYFADKPKNLGETLLSFSGDLADALGAGFAGYAGRESPTRLQKQYQMRLASQQQANQMAASLDMELQKMPIETSQAIRKALAEKKYDLAASLAGTSGNAWLQTQLAQMAYLIQYSQGQGKLSDIGDPRAAANADSGKVGQ